MATCSRCEKPRASGHKYCLEHKAAYMREWRQTHPLRADQRLKAKLPQVRESVSEACTPGAGAVREVRGYKAEKHHPDYSKPLSVVWLCRTCHLAHHSEQH